MMNETMPKGMITEGGVLYVERRGRLVSAVCPFSSTENVSVKCGEWCSHFGEPGLSEVYLGRPKDKVMVKMYMLHLSCGVGRRFMFDEFDDKRLAPPTEAAKPDVSDESQPDGGVPI